MSAPHDQPPAFPADGLGDAEHRRPLGIQVTVVLLATVINMLDGYDLLAVAFAGPHIVAEWRVTPAALGTVFGMGLAGIAAGSLLLSPIADRAGRRVAILLGLALISTGMLLVPATGALWQLGLLRLVTGLGIGTLFSSLNTIVAEYSPPWSRSLSIGIYASGYPLGAALSGSISLYIVAHYGWRAIFLCGGVASLALIPAVLLLMPESIAFLLQRQPDGALKRARRIAARLGYRLTELPAKEVRLGSPLLALAVPGLRGRAAALGGAFLLLWTTSFFVQNWNPTILTREGAELSASTASGVLLTVGGIAGTLSFGLLSLSFRLERLTMAYFTGGFLAATCFALTGPANTPVLLASSAAMGLFLIGASSGLYALAAKVFPVDVRSAGTGVVLAAGRLGSVVGVYLGGVLIGAGLPRAVYYIALALPALIGAASVDVLARRTEGP